MKNKVMKANAPEKLYTPQKIYLPYKDGKVIGIVKETGVPFKSGVDGNIEYTRTDAFIEKACEWLRNNSHNYANNALGKEYLVNDFEDYMKGENE